MQSENTVSSIWDVTYYAVLDMSGMVTMLESFDTGSSSDTPKNLCKVFNDDEIGDFYTNSSCESLGDYRASIISTLPKDNNPGIYVWSGVIVYNVLLSKTLGKDANNNSTDTVKMQDYGVKIDATFKFPYPIVYLDAGEKPSSNVVHLNMFDKKVMKRQELYIIARADGKKPTKIEITKYKQKVRQQIIKAKKSGKFKEFQELSGL